MILHLQNIMNLLILENILICHLIKNGILMPIMLVLYWMLYGHIVLNMAELIWLLYLEESKWKNLLHLEFRMRSLELWSKDSRLRNLAYKEKYRKILGSLKIEELCYSVRTMGKDERLVSCCNLRLTIIINLI